MSDLSLSFYEHPEEAHLCWCREPEKHIEPTHVREAIHAERQAIRAAIQERIDMLEASGLPPAPSDILAVVDLRYLADR